MAKKNVLLSPTLGQTVVKLSISPDRTTAQLPNGLRLLKPASPPDPCAIALRAWEIWKAEGSPEDRALEHWLRAERELRIAS